MDIERFWPVGGVLAGYDNATVRASIAPALGYGRGPGEVEISSSRFDGGVAFDMIRNPLLRRAFVRRLPDYELLGPGQLLIKTAPFTLCK